jgi:lysyl-tRNA synthetase class 1
MGVIPRAVDDYWQFRANYPTQDLKQRLGNPVHHIHDGNVPTEKLPVTFGLLLNLASLPGVGDAQTMWRFLQRYDAGLSPEANPALDRLVGYAVAYGRDFVAPTLVRRAPTDAESAALTDLDAALAEPVEGDDVAGVLQDRVYEIGKAHYGKEALRDWFKTLYETLLGSSQGPRMGSFFALYGVDNSRKLIAEALAR